LDIILISIVSGIGFHGLWGDINVILFGDALISTLVYQFIPTKVKEKFYFYEDSSNHSKMENHKKVNMKFLITFEVK
jgi:hypothetical protein